MLKSENLLKSLAIKLNEKYFTKIKPWLNQKFSDFCIIIEFNQTPKSIIVFESTSFRVKINTDTEILFGFVSYTRIFHLLFFSLGKDKIFYSTKTFCLSGLTQRGSKLIFRRHSVVYICAWNILARKERRPVK